MNLTNVADMLQKAHNNSQLEFTLVGKVEKDGSINVTGVNLCAKEPERAKIAGFAQSKD